MAIYFKFKSAKDYDSIPIDGHFISIGNLKEKIFESKHLGRGTDFDLVVSNPNTEEEYLDEAMLLPKNTSVLVRRVPGRPRMPIVTEREEPKETEHHADKASQSKHTVQLPGPSQSNFPEESEWDEFGTDLYAIPQVPQVQSANVVESIPSRIEEESKIKAHIDMTDLDWQRQLQEASSSGRGFRRGTGGRMMPGRGFGRGGMESKTPPPGYICHRCKVPGHFIQHCPTNGDPNYDIRKVKPPTGIPKSMLMPTPDGSYALPSGAVAVLRPNEAAFEKEIEGLPSTRSVSDLPAELRCPLCKEVLKDAVFTSKCCYESFCDKCIREYIIVQAKCVCGATNVLADDLLPNKRLRDTINRILETKTTSSAENGGSLLQIQDMESARCPQPKLPSPTLSGTANEDKMQRSPKGSTQELKETVPEVLETATIVSAPQQSNGKSKAAKSVDQMEVTYESMSMKDPVSQDSAPQTEEEVQQKLSLGDSGKKKIKKKRLRPPVNPMDMQWRMSQDFGAESSVMPVAPAYNTYWPGMQLGLDGYMPGYGAGLAYMGYPNPYDLSFRMLPQDPFVASGYMLPAVPPQSLREFPEYGIGPNPTPPPMTREEFEARKADVRRRRESEQRSERESSKDRDRSSREVNAIADTHQPMKRPRLMPQAVNSDRPERPTSPERSRDADSVRLSPRASNQRKQEYEDYSAANEKLADRKQKGSVFSRISFPGSGDGSKKRKVQEPANGLKEKDEARSHHDHRGKQSSRKSSHDYDCADDDDLHFKRRGSSSRYKSDQRELESRSHEVDHGRGHDCPRDRERSTRH